MLYSLCTRPLIARLTFTLLLGAQMLGWIIAAHAGETPPPERDSHRTEQSALREFDRFLDHHPLLEDLLRRNPQLTDNPAFLKKNPELMDFLKINVKVAEGLKLYPRYFLNRGLLRQANAPVSFKELAAFQDLFRQQPKLEKELTEAPELIRDPDFRKSHPALHDFLSDHPVLDRVFLTSNVQTVHN